MSDLKSTKLIYLKAVLFVFILLFSVGLILLEAPSWKVLFLLALTIWASARLYYFMFYVIENYVDEGYKFAGISSFIRYLFSKKKSPPEKD